jgi:hypothetical protein
MMSGRDGPEKRGERGVGAGCEARASMRSGRDGPEKLLRADGAMVPCDAALQ